MKTQFFLQATSKRDKKTIFCFLITIFFLTISLATNPAGPNNGKIPASSVLCANGTLDLDRGLEGSIDLLGFTVTMDEEMGPLFTPAPPPAPSWQALGSGLNNNVNSIAISGGDVYVGGYYTNAGGNASADNIARWGEPPCPDNDGDGYTDAACGGTDCDDTNAAIHPGATETCNNIDDNCNGQIDEGLSQGFQFTYTFTNTSHCSTVNVTWTGGCPTWLVDISLALVSTNTGVLSIATGLPNTGSYSWTVPSSLAPDNYFFYVPGASSGGNGIPFSISSSSGTEICNGLDDDYNGIVDDVPINLNYSFNCIDHGQQVAITWTGGCPGWTVDLALIRVNPFVVETSIVQGIPNNGSYLWTVPSNLDCDEFQLYIQESSGPVWWHYGQNFWLGDADDDGICDNSDTETCDGIDNDCDGLIDEGNICCPVNGILYVNHAATGANTGQSWADAFTELQPAIDQAATCSGVTQIWVAQGTYYPTHDSNGNPAPSDPTQKVFYIDADMEIYGGFDGTETQLSQRDFRNRVTILSGDIDNNDAANPATSYTQVAGSNTRRVVFLKNNTQACILDGFTVTAGKTSGEGSGIVISGSGSGNSANPIVRNCTISGCKAFRGAGMLIWGGGGSNNTSTISDCIFFGNYGTQRAGAIYISGWNGGSCSPTLTNCLFYKNQAQTGAAIFTLENNQQTHFINCTFYGNLSPDRGGASFNYNADPLFTNCIFWANTGTGKTVYNLAGAQPEFEYCLIEESSCSALHGTNTCSNSIFGQDPLVVNAANDDYHLQNASPAIDAGTSAGAPLADLDGVTRPLLAGVDMGVFESYCYGGTIICYVDNDGDGYGDNFSPPQMFCLTCGPGYSADSLDCNDSDPNIYPGATEICNGIDDDCDGLIDSADPNYLDNIPPSVYCLNPTVSLDSNGQVTISVSDVFDSANSSDNCGTVIPVFATPTNFSCADIGVQQVTVQAIDLAGNTAICVASLTIADTDPPAVACKNTNVTLNSQGQASTQPIEVFDSASDNCGNFSLTSVSPNNFDCSNQGSNTVTLTVSDGNGNSGTCTAVVSVFDNISPIAICHSSVIVALDQNGQATISPSDVDDGSVDNCDIPSLSISQSTFDCSHIGANTVTLTVQDNSGNTNSCNATVTVQDSSIPTAQCQNLTTDLDPDGTYTLSPASINNGSSDNCGSINLTVNPSSFDCSHIGANSVTLTVDDGNGNTSTCSATVNINPFITISSITATDESCANAGDGTITVSATATGGTLVYSINGGASYQGSSIFTNLSSGSYSIKVLAQGTGCTATGSATINAGPSPTTWYKDLDGDGYTDGITQVTCGQPAGYVASALPGDCNDNDASVNPGAPEACNGVDDNCDGNIPANELDNDADGYRVCDGDCNDSNPAINPGAAEICNGFDDNCNGQIDEGNPPANQVYVGNLAFTTQNAINNFSQCYYKVQGNLTIQGTSINSLANLSNLQEVTGNVTIQVTSLPNMNGLDGLTTIGGSLTIKLNNYGTKLTSLSGLGSLTSIGQNLFIYFNFSLSDCCSIDDLLSNSSVGGVTSIHHNAPGCNSVGDIGNTCGGNNIIISSGNSMSNGEQVEGNRLTVFPNPASHEVTIAVSKILKENGVMNVFDSLGRLIWHQEVVKEENSWKIDLNLLGFNRGLYMVTLKTSQEQLNEYLHIY